MASAYSSPKDFGNYIKPVNTELVNFVLESKQQKFDYNLAKVEQTLEQFGQLGLVRGQDKQYLADKINTIVSGMGDVGSMDWSDPNVERQITSGIKGAIDGRVRNDIQMSRKYTNYMEEAQRIKEEDPDRYSDINFAMGLKYAEADKWLNGETDKFGNLEFIPKVDYMGQMNETIQSYIKTHGTKEVERIPNGDGTYTTVEREVLKGETIRNLWQANITPEMQRQMQMEADYMYGDLGEEDQADLVESYTQNVVREQNNLKKELDRYKSAAKGASGAEKAQIQEQIKLLEGRNLELDAELKEGVSFQEAYLNQHFKGTREKIVEANAFNRQTDIKTDYDELKALKMRRDLVGSETTEAEKQAEDYAIVADPFRAEDTTAENVFEKTENGMTSAIEEFTQAMVANGNFEDSYDITIEEFNNKSEEEQIEFATDTMQKLIEDGVDLAADKTFSGRELEALSKYRSNKTVYDEVNTGIETATNDIAKNSFKALQKGVSEGTINIDNFNVSPIRRIVNSGRSFEELKPDERNAFRVAMIDEAIRSGSAEEGIRPYLLKQREDLINQISDENLASQFPREELLTDTRGAIGAYTRAGINQAIGGLDFVAESLGSLLNLDDIIGEQNRSEESFREAREYNEEANRRGNLLSIFRNDEGLRELQADEFEIDGEGVNAMDYINNKYRAVTENAELVASENAPRLTSTSALVINPNIKSQQEMFNRASTYLAAHNSASVDDIKSSEMYMRVNPENNTVTFNAKLTRAAAKDYDGDGDLPENRMISSNPIPISEIGDMDAIMSRLKTEQDEWSLNSENRYAQNLKFTTKGFNTPEQRMKAVEGVMDKLPADAALMLRQTPESLGLTHTEMETYLQDASRETSDGQIRSLREEFPNAYAHLTSGEGTFEVEYKSQHNQGYFMDINYVLGDRTIGIHSSLPTGNRVLNPDQAYLEAYQTQTDTFLNIIQGYMSGDDKMINRLKEIDKING